MSFLDDFLWYVSGERRLSAATVQSYKGDLAAWAAGGVDFEAGAPDPAAVLGAVERFEKSKIEESTVARRLASLRSFVRYRSLRDPIWRELLDKLPKARGSESLPRALSVEEIARFLDFDPGADPRLLRNRALFEMIYASGLRVSEAIALTGSQIDERTGALRVLGKGKKERFVPYSERAGEWLARYREHARPEWADGIPKRYEDHVFLSARKRPLTRMAVWKLIHQRALVCGVDNLHPHVLRHSFATHLLQGGADVRFVQAMLGHSSLATTERYLKMGDQDLKKLFEEFHPLG